MTSRPFVVLFGAVLVATMGISMVSPLLPVYAETLGASGLWIGLTFSIFAVTQTAVSPFAGGWSDRYGRRPFIIGGLLLYLVAALGYLTADSFVQVLAFRALSGGGTSLIFSVARAYIGDIVPPGREGTWFGAFAVADVIGFGIGPIFAGTIREAYGFDAVFVGMALLMGSAATIVAVLLPAHGAGERQPEHLDRSAFGSFGLLRDPVVLALTLTTGLISLSFGSVLSFLGVRLDALGVSPFVVGVAFAMESLAGGIAQPLFGYVADHADRRAVVAGGLVFASAWLVVLGLVDGLPLVMLALFCIGFGASAAGVGSGAMQVVVGRRVGMGTMIGLAAMGNGIGVVLGSVAGGLVVTLVGDPTGAFYFAATAMLCGAGGFLLLARGRAEAARAIVP